MAERFPSGPSTRPDPPLQQRRQSPNPASQSMRRLFGCTVSLLYEDARGEATLNAPIARRTEFWWSERQPGRDVRFAVRAAIPLSEGTDSGAFMNKYGKPLLRATLGAQRLFPGADSSWEASWEPSVPEATAHALALHELREVLLPAGTKGTVLRLGRRHGGQVRRVHPTRRYPASTEIVLQKAERQAHDWLRKIARTAFDKLLDGIRPRVQPHVGDLRRRRTE